MIKIEIKSYLEWKDNLLDKNLRYFSYAINGSYRLSAIDGDITYTHDLSVDDVADYEANLLLGANKKVEKVIIGSAFSSSMLEDGKVLYLKIHGMKAVIPAGGSHEFLFTIPYTEAYLQGAEIFIDILSQTDMTIKHPVAGVLEQYGFNVCMGKVIYKREAKYAAKLPQGLQVSAICTNTEATEQEMGVNFILHEIRDGV